MRIGIVGGITRSERALRAAAAEHGHELAFHDGEVGGRGSDALVELVRGVDVVIVVTDVNSHGAVLLARRVARRLDRHIQLHRRLSPRRLATLARAFGAGEARR